MFENECLSLSSVVCDLRYLSMVSQHLHWTVSGATSMQDHQMLGGLYEACDGFFDSVAERVVGLGGLAPTVAEHLKYVYACAKRDGDVASMQGVGEMVVRTAQELNQVAACEGLSEGTKNLLAGIADELEKQAYFFQQRSR